MSDVTAAGERLRFVKNETAPGYDGVFVALHWLTVLLLIAQYATVPGLWVGGGTARAAMHWHASLGPTILLVMVLRLGWRVIRPVPPPPDDLSLQLQVASRATHWVLYALIIGQCCGGWLEASLAGVQPTLLGVVPLPRFVPPNHELAHLFGFWHGMGALLVAAVIGLHVAGALHHAVIKRDGVVSRMLPGGGRD